MSERIQEYRGKRVLVRFDGQKCIHSRFCVLVTGTHSCRIPALGPPDGASPETVAEIAHTVLRVLSPTNAWTEPAGACLKVNGGAFARMDRLPSTLT